MKAQKLFGLDGEWIKTLLTSLLVLGLAAGIAGCSSTSATRQPPPPSPSISSISPSSATASAAGFTLTVNGSNFVQGAVVQWNGASRATTFVSSTQLTAAILGSDTAAAGPVQITVLNPAGGSNPSNAMTFTVTVPPNPVPTLSSLLPLSAIVSGTNLTLTVNGSNFVSGSIVSWGGAAPATTFVSGTQLTAAIPASFLTAAGPVPVSVINPTPGGGQSNALTFTVNNPLPALTSLSPARLQAGAAPFTLTVNGSGFIADSTVQWGGASRATTFVNNTQLTMPVSTSDVAAPGAVQVTVANPPPGGGAASLIFTIDPSTNNPTPSITSLSDTSAPASWPGFPLTVNGAGFVATSAGQFNGFNRPTTVFSSTLLKTAIPASDLATAGTGQFSVFNSSPGGGTSNATTLAIKPFSAGAVGVIERSSLATDLTEGDADSWGFPAISGDGRFIAFSSNASTLVPGDTNGFEDVFLRDTCINAPAGCMPSVVRVSVATDGTQGNRSSFGASISANGRYVTFVSDATNLVPGDTNGTQDVFVRATCFGAPAGCLPSTTRVSLDNNDNQIPLDNTDPVLSADGRFVTFISGTFGDGYTTGDSFDVFVRDTCAGVPAGCKPSTVPVSVAPDGLLGNGPSYGPVPSGDGRYVVFTSVASNLVPSDTNGSLDVFLRDTCFGAPVGCKPATMRVSVADDGTQANQDSFASSYSLNGRFVAFTSAASNVVTDDTNGTQDVFVRDTCLGVSTGCTPSTARVSLANDGTQGNAYSGAGSLSADGRFVAFHSNATNLVAGEINNSTNIFLRDTCLGAPAGCKPSTIRLSVALDGTAGNNSSFGPAISCDARYVAFQSLANNLGPGDTNNFIDVFLARTGKP